MKKLFAIISFVYLVSHLPAQTVIWTGNSFGHNHLWGDKDNWSTGIVPGPSDDVLIENDSVIVLNVNPEISSLKLDSAILLNQKQMTFTNSDTFGILATESKIYNKGIIQMDEVGENEFGDRAIQVQFNSVLINDSLINIMDAKGYGMWITSSQVTNNSIIQVTSGKTGILVSGSTSLLDNLDSISINTPNSTAISLNNGNTNNQSGGCINITGSVGVVLSTTSYLENRGSMFINITQIFAILLTFTSEMDHFEGTIWVQNNNPAISETISLKTSSTLNIFPGAHIEASSVANGTLEIEAGSIFNCEGTITFQN